MVSDINASKGPIAPVRKAESKLFRTTFVRSQILVSKEISIFGPAGLSDRDYFVAYHGRSTDSLCENNLRDSQSDKGEMAVL